MNRQQTEWAKQHDWCLFSGWVHDGHGDGVWVVLARPDDEAPAATVFQVDGVERHGHLFTDYEQLRAWAGY